MRDALRIEVGGQELRTIRLSGAVAWGSQTPTQWWSGGESRPLDALMRVGRTPWVVEMKDPKAGGGYGKYLRHAIAQAVLYRHFLRTATAYGPWFDSLDLEQQAMRALVLYPRPTASVQRTIAPRIGALWQLASAFDVQLTAVDAPELGKPESVIA